MKKHTSRVGETVFARKLEEGEEFAISIHTMMRFIRRELNERGLDCERVPLWEHQTRHFSVYRVLAKGKSDG